MQWRTERIVIMADLNRFSNQPNFVYKNTIEIHLFSDNIVIRGFTKKRYYVAKKKFRDNSFGY
jgi:hypothetical protein